MSSKWCHIMRLLLPFNFSYPLILAQFTRLFYCSLILLGNYQLKFMYTFLTWFTLMVLCVVLNCFISCCIVYYYSKTSYNLQYYMTIRLRATCCYVPGRDSCCITFNISYRRSSHFFLTGEHSASTSFSTSFGPFFSHYLYVCHFFRFL